MLFCIICSFLIRKYAGCLFASKLKLLRATKRSIFKFIDQPGTPSGSNTSSIQADISLRGITNLSVLADIGSIEVKQGDEWEEREFDENTAWEKDSPSEPVQQPNSNGQHTIQIDGGVGTVFINFSAAQ